MFTNDVAVLGPVGVVDTVGDTDVGDFVVIVIVAAAVVVIVFAVVVDGVDGG